MGLWEFGMLRKQIGDKSRDKDNRGTGLILTV
jgi:hypothetical protein